MPRHRTISCTHCGFMQLKRDYFCESCSSLTKRAKVDLIGKAIQITLILIAGVWVYSKITG